MKPLRLHYGVFAPTHGLRAQVVPKPVELAVVDDEDGGVIGKLLAHPDVGTVAERFLSHEFD